MGEAEMTAKATFNCTVPIASRHGLTAFLVAVFTLRTAPRMSASADDDRVALYHLTNTFPIRSGNKTTLVSAFGERADIITALAVMRIVRPEALRNISDHLEESFLSELLGMEGELTSQFLSRFLAELGKDERSRHVMFGSMIDNDDVLVYDLTSFKSSSRGNGYLEYGTEYRTTGLPQANFGLVHSLHSDLPVYYKLFPGSINDVVTLRNLVSELKEMGVADAHLLLDRGFFSESNLDMMLSKGLGFTIPVPFSRKIAKTLMSESNREIDNPEQHAFSKVQ